MCGHIAQALKRRDERTPPPHTPRRYVPDTVYPASASRIRTRNDWFDRSPNDALACPRGGERNLARVDVGGSGVPTRTPKVGRSLPGDWRVTGENNATFPTVAVGRNRKRGHDQARELRDEREAVSSLYLAAAIGCPRIPAAAVGAAGSEEEPGRLPLDVDPLHRHGEQSSYNPMGNQFREGLDLGRTRFRQAARIV